VIDDKLRKNKEERKIETEEGRKEGEKVQYSRENVPNPA
jgi:hypothetical protein